MYRGSIVSDSIKMFNGATYVTFVDIGLVWCVAGDVIKCHSRASIQKSMQRRYGNRCSSLLCDCFLSEIMGSKIVLLTIFLSLYFQLVWPVHSCINLVVEIFSRAIEVASLVIAFCSTVESCSKSGICSEIPTLLFLNGSDSWVHVLSHALRLLLGRMGHLENFEPFKSLDADTMEAARLANYWIADTLLHVRGAPNIDLIFRDDGVFELGRKEKVILGG